MFLEPWPNPEAIQVEDLVVVVDSKEDPLPTPLEIVVVMDAHLEASCVRESNNV